MKLKSKAHYPIPAQVVLKPYGIIWIDVAIGNQPLRKREVKLTFIDHEPTEEEYVFVGCYLYDEGFIEAVDRRNMRDIAKARKAKRAARAGIQPKP